MRRQIERVTVCCTACGHDFHLTPRAYARRVASHGDRLLCQACLSELWLWGRGRYLTDRLVADDAVRAPASDEVVP